MLDFCFLCRYAVKAMPTFAFVLGGKKLHTVQGANEAGLRAAVQAMNSPQ